MTKIELEVLSDNIDEPPEFKSNSLKHCKPVATLLKLLDFKIFMAVGHHHVVMLLQPTLEVFEVQVNWNLFSKTMKPLGLLHHAVVLGITKLACG